MKIRLIENGPKRIAVIKEIRSAWWFDLKVAKSWSDKAPVEMPPLPDEVGARAVRALRDAGATVDALADSTVLDKITAASYIQTAAAALGEGNIKDTRISLRAALRLIGDYDIDSELTV